MSTRREAREKVMQALYARELSGDEVKHVIRHVIEPTLAGTPAAVDFATKLFLRTLDGRAELDEMIDGHTKNWELSRIALIDKIVLRMAITEFLTFEDIPPKVTINEAIEVAKRFSTPRSGQFINGILDAVLADLKRDGRLQKRGRGLVDVTVQTGHKKPKASDSDD